METKHEDIKLTDIIVSESNKMFRDEQELSAIALQDLIGSIKEHGVIQPILVREKFIRGAGAAKGSYDYELVCGERRFRASKYAGLTTIPATIRELTNDQAFALQVTENLQRKDVHPLREAFAYKYLVEQDAKANTPAELALRFGKTEHYIQTRLKLNDLIPEAKKDFADGLMTIGHALLIARLTPADQKTAIDNCTESYINKEKKRVRFYSTINELEQHINDDVICNLTTAAFKKEDATLLPKAGACTACPKRSGSGQLFADVNDKDRCFDRACFMAKRMKFMCTQVPVILEKEPDTVFLQGKEKLDPEISKVLTENKVHVLHIGKDFNTHDWNNKAKIKGTYVNGDQVGKTVTVYSTKEKAPAGKSTPEKVDAKEAINRINDRLERARELDQEKIYTNVIELLETNKAVDVLTNKITIPERGIVAHMVYEHADYSVRETIDKKFGLKKITKGQDIASFFKEVTPGQLAWMVRQIAIKKYASPYHNDQSMGILITEMAVEFNVPVADVISKQNELKKKREANAVERKRQLQPMKKAKPKGLSALLKK